MASGSEAAVNASHLVLLDSNFGSMPEVVAEGRRVINHIQRVATLFLTKTIFSLLLALLALVGNGDYPIKTSQLMIIEILVIGIPSFMLTFEANKNRVTGKFLGNVLKNALPGALVIMINTLIIFAMVPILNVFPEITGVEGAAVQKQIMSTLIVVTATFACFMVLFKVTSPFNFFRRSLFTIMLGLATLGILLLPDFFEFIPFFEMDRLVIEGQTLLVLPLDAILFLLCILQATFPAIHVVQNLVPWIKSATSKFLKAVTRT